ncbi:6,7-dimethyl-8-ribityllumazine synthase [Wenzhouxiangella limi]|uniref:6,7-dimethyl-8-ribityllumazine synthase n=1 Tax=Wenzhouxiangella limi TaxID=2707351 RepID=UPI0030B8189B
MIKEIDCRPECEGRRVAVAVARFNAEVTERLWTGCRDALETGGVADITRVNVPGAFELPLTCRWLAESERFDAVIALGAVVRGQTAHFDFISAECTRGLGQIALEARIPVAFGVLTPENAEQALERADPVRKNKGGEVALAALEMMALAEAIARG